MFIHVHIIYVFSVALRFDILWPRFVFFYALIVRALPFGCCTCMIKIQIEHGCLDKVVGETN